MIEGLKPYVEYRYSGQRWLGQVPRQWASFPLRRVATPKSECGRSDLELLSVYLHRGVIRYADSGGQVHKPSLDLSKYQVVAPGDFVLNNQQAWRGSIGVSKFQGIISPAYVVLRLSPKLNPRYANYLFRSPPMVAQYVAASRGVGDIQRNLFYPDLRNSIAIVPPPSEQAAIVRFLDHANRKIDGYIRANRKLIGLLNEQKQAIIHRSVTRGSRPDVALEPSGTSWLAEAPANWAWIPIKRLLSRMDYGTSQKSTASGSIRILTMGNIQNGEVTVPRSGGLNYLPDPLLLEHHDLLFTRTNGNPNLVGKVGIFRGEVTDKISFASYLVRLRVKRLYDPEWLHMVLNSAAFWPFARSHALVNLQTNLNSTRYGQFAVPVPPLVEQKEIVQWVGKESKPLTTAIARTEREIALMQEYRTRLTADIVAGKLDVREAAAKLPDLPVEPANEPLAEDEPLEEIEIEERI